MRPFYRFLVSCLLFIVGVGLGGYLFRGRLPRSIINLDHCQDGACLQANDAAGLLASVGIAINPKVLPNIIEQTDKTVVIEHPFPQAPLHYVIIPKKDIKNIGELQPGDEAYVVDAYRVMQSIIVRQHLRNYKIITNGPDFQQVTYLHFHLVSY